MEKNPLEIASNNLKTTVQRATLQNPYLLIMLPYIVVLWVLYCHIYPLKPIRRFIISSVLLRYVRWVVVIWFAATCGYLAICIVFAIRTSSAPSSRLHQALSGIAVCARRSINNRCNSQEHMCVLLERECWALTRCLSQSRRHIIVFELFRQCIDEFWSSFYSFIAIVSLYVLLTARFPEHVVTDGSTDASSGLHPGLGLANRGSGATNTAANIVNTHLNPASASVNIQNDPAVSSNGKIPAEKFSPGPANSPDRVGRISPPRRLRIPRNRLRVLARENATLTEEFLRLPGDPDQNRLLWGSGLYAEAFENQPPHVTHGSEAVGLLAIRPPPTEPAPEEPKPHPAPEEYAYVDTTGRLFCLRNCVTGMVVPQADGDRILGIIRGRQPLDPSLNPFAMSPAERGAWQRANLERYRLIPIPIEPTRNDLAGFRGALVPRPIFNHPAAFVDEDGRSFWISTMASQRPVPIKRAMRVLGIRRWERRNGEGEEHNLIRPQTDLPIDEDDLSSDEDDLSENEEGLMRNEDNLPNIEDTTWILPEGIRAPSTATDSQSGSPLEASPSTNGQLAITEASLRRYHLTVRWHPSNAAASDDCQRPIGRLEQPTGNADPNPLNHWRDEEGRIFMIQGFHENLARNNDMEHRDLPYNEVIQRLNARPPAAQPREENIHHPPVSSTVRKFWRTSRARSYFTTDYNMWPGDMFALCNDRLAEDDTLRTEPLLPQGALTFHNQDIFGRTYDHDVSLIDEADIMFFFYTEGELPVSPQAVYELIGRQYLPAAQLRSYFGPSNWEAQQYSLVGGGFYPHPADAFPNNLERMRLPRGALRRYDGPDRAQAHLIMLDEEGTIFIVLDENLVAQHPQDVLKFLERYPRFIGRTVREDLRPWFETEVAAENNILVKNNMFPLVWAHFTTHAILRLPRGYLRRIGADRLSQLEQHRLNHLLVEDEDGTLFLVYDNEGYAIHPDDIVTFYEACQARADLMAKWAQMKMINFAASEHFTLAYPYNPDGIEEGKLQVHVGDLRPDPTDRSFLLDRNGTRFRVYTQAVFLTYNLAASVLANDLVLDLQAAFFEVYDIAPEDGRTQLAEEEEVRERVSASVEGQDSESASVTGGEFPASEPTHGEDDEEHPDAGEREYPRSV